MRRYPPYLQPRGGRWHYYRKVPLWARKVETRKFVDKTTGKRIADDPHGRRAAIVAHALNDVEEQRWAARIQGNGEAAEANYADAVGRCLALGHAPIDLYALAADPAAIVQRTATIKAHVRADQTINGHGAAAEAAAVCGLVTKVTVRIANMATKLEEVRKEKIKKVEWQWVKWRRPYVKVADELKSVVGNLDLSQLTKDHIQQFRTWKRKQVEAGHYGERTANHHFSDLSGMYRHLMEAKPEWKLDMGIFTGIRYKIDDDEDEENNRRPPFSNDFIQKKLLADGAFDKLENPEAARAFYVIVETGLRNAEVLNLRRKRVRDLFTNGIPFAQVRGDGRKLKNKNSKRVMPLVGVARKAIEAQVRDINAKLAAAGKEQSPDDPIFPSYIDDPGVWSKEVNAFLDANGLCENVVHEDDEDEDGRETSIYSLRHSFKDRMINLEIGDESQDFMMGHKKKKVRYGNGPSLELKHKWLDRMMFTPPHTV